MKPVVTWTVTLTRAGQVKSATRTERGRVSAAEWMLGYLSACTKRGWVVTQITSSITDDGQEVLPL